MFKVSALLLDDALKSATPLTNGAINETLGQCLGHPVHCRNWGGACNQRAHNPLNDTVQINAVAINDEYLHLIDAEYVVHDVYL